MTAFLIGVFTLVTGGIYTVFSVIPGSKKDSIPSASVDTIWEKLDYNSIRLGEGGGRNIYPDYTSG